MSRSYKHIGFCKCEKSCKIGKKFANKRVRNYKGEIPNGKAYKKIYNSWDICDYYNIETWNSYKKWWSHPRWWQEPREVSYFDYYKDYKMK